MTTSSYLLPHLFSMPIYTDPAFGAQLKPYPRRLTKYRKRTLKRWARNPAHWTAPKMYIANGAVWCAPEELEKVRQIVEMGMGMR